MVANIKNRQLSEGTSFHTSAVQALVTRHRPGLHRVKCHPAQTKLSSMQTSVRRRVLEHSAGLPRQKRPNSWLVQQAAKGAPSSLLTHCDPWPHKPTPSGGGNKCHIRHCPLSWAWVGLICKRSFLSRGTHLCRTMHHDSQFPPMAVLQDDRDHSSTDKWMTSSDRWNNTCTVANRAVTNCSFTTTRFSRHLGELFLCGTLPRFHWLQKQLNSLISTQRLSLHQAKRVRSPAGLLQPCNKSKVQKKPA